MTRLTAIVAIMAVGILPTLVAADMVPITLSDLEVDGWEVADGPKTWAGGAVEEKLGDVADLHKGYNLINSQWVLLKRGDRELDVFVFTYDTAANAYGLFSVMRNAIMDTATAEPVEVGDQALYHKKGAMLVWAGRCGITLTSASADAPARKTFARIATQLAAQVQGKADKPELVEKLPAGNLSESSIIYGRYRNALDRVLDVGEENVLGLGEDVDVPTGVEAVYGRYTIDDRPHGLLAVRYPEAAAAEKAAQAFAAMLANSADSDTKDGAWRDIGARDGKHTLTYRSGNLLAIAPEAVAVAKMKAIIREMSTFPAEAAMLPQPIIYRG